MSLASLKLLVLVVLVEGSITQWKNNSNTPDVSPVAAETTHGGQELDTVAGTVTGIYMNQIRSGESTILADGKDGVTCPHWLFPIHTENGSTACECGNDLKGVVKCNNETQKVKILQCYCMTYSSDDNTSLVVGECFYSCQLIRHLDYPLPSNVSQVCALFQRAGQLCGKCKDGFAPPVYSYNSSCVNCTEYSNNWVKYMAISFLPPTALFLVVITFRVSATSGLLNVFILVSQIVSAPYLVRVIAITNPTMELLYYVGLSLYGIWNLDFFRLLYSPFCLHPKMTTLQALALDYAIAVYPLLLTVFTYLLVEMHDHNVRIVVWLWKPFHACFVHFRRRWNIKGSLIDAFATFLLLSYVKLLYTSFSFLFPVYVFNIHGKALNKLYLYYDGTVEYFGPEHLPFAIIAIIVLLVFNTLPLFLLVLYPCRCFQRCLNHYNIHYQVLHTFMDVFQGSYKDGTSGTHDCRWFAALYLMLRIALLVVYASINNDFVIFPIIVLLMVPVFLTAIFHPHKSPFHNATDVFLLLVLVAIGVSLLSIQVAYHKALRSLKSSLVLNLIFVSIPILYFITIIFYKLFPCKRFVQKVHHKLCLQEPNYEELFPDRLVNAEQYEPLPSTETFGNQNEVTDILVNHNNGLDSLVTY